MNAKIENIVNRNRNNLYEVLPLDMPYSLFIDVCNLCNFKCRFCAIQYSKKKLNFNKQIMSFDLFKKVIDDLSVFPRPLKMLRLAANGEPLINTMLPDMIDYAKEKGVADFIEIVTNGSLLNSNMTKRLVGIDGKGLDRIRISIEALDSEGYAKIAGVKLNWKEFISNIQYFYDNKQNCEVYIKTVDTVVNNKYNMNKFYEIFGGMCDKISVEHIIPIWVGYDQIYNDFNISKEEGLHGHKLRDVLVCPFPFYSCVVNPDGEMTVCCNDWERKIVIGDVSKEYINDIWNSEKYRNFLMGMLESGRKNNHNACMKCVYPCYDSVDDIDEYSSIILEKFTKLMNTYN